MSVSFRHSSFSTVSVLHVVHFLYEFVEFLVDWLLLYRIVVQSTPGQRGGTFSCLVLFSPPPTGNAGGFFFF